LETAQKTTDTTNENIMIRLRPWAGESIADLDQFVTMHKTFLLYYQGGSPNSSVEALLKRKCTVTVARKDGPELLFRCDCSRP
jgi:hypothetical protein